MPGADVRKATGSAGNIRMTTKVKVSAPNKTGAEAAILSRMKTRDEERSKFVFPIHPAPRGGRILEMRGSGPLAR
jgi:hypothetical protein